MSELIDHLVVYDSYRNVHIEIFNEIGALQGYSYTLGRLLNEDELFEVVKEIFTKNVG